MEPSKIGKVQTEGVLGERDAFHVPCVLTSCDYNIAGNTNVKFVDKSLTKVTSCGFVDRHGIVDPFLSQANSGQLFWVLLNPNLVTKLNHQFEVNLEIDDSEPEYDECSGCYGSPSYDENDDEYEDNSCRGCY